MPKINPFKPRYHDFYWQIADAAASQSAANRLKVGAVIVAQSGMLSTGWNGMPAGWYTNTCEHTEGPYRAPKTVTSPEVIHAERNAIDKMTRQGVPTEGAYCFITHAPCLECAKQLYAIGIAEVFYREPYRSNDGIHFLTRMEVPLHHCPGSKEFPANSPS